MIYDLFQVSNELANVYKLDALGGVYGDVPQVPAGPRCLLHRPRRHGGADRLGQEYLH